MFVGDIGNLVGEDSDISDHAKYDQVEQAAEGIEGLHLEDEAADVDAAHDKSMELEEEHREKAQQSLERIEELLDKLEEF